MDTQQLITLIPGILTVIVIFQTRIGKIFASLKYDIQSMEIRLGNRIDEVKIDLKQDIHNVEVRLNGNETESNSEERIEAEAV